jgi:putative ABC transport system permease protein
LLARRRRTALTALAVVVGVAMISGAYVFTDTINAALRELFSSQAKGAQVMVASPQGLYSASNPPATLPASLATRVAQLPGVASAQGQIADVATVVGRDGKAIKKAGSPTLALSYLPAPFTGLRFLVGGPPSGAQDVALDQATARRAHYRVGDLVPIVTGQPARAFRVSGIASLGSASIGDATFVVFGLKTAQAQYQEQGLLNAIYVAGRSGMRPQTLTQEIRPLLPPGIIAQPVPRALNTDVAQLSDQLGVLTGGLEAFGFIAMFVGAFVIFNTLAITVAQRTRELALLRALGATRDQVLGSVILEAGVIGILSSVAGVLAGPAVTLLIRAVLKAVGVDVPSTGLAIEPRTAIIGLAVGIGVSLAAGVLPAVRATGVTPIEAMREGVAPRKQRRTWQPGVIAALVLAFVGAGLTFTTTGSSNTQLGDATAGAVLMLLAAVLVVPIAIPPLARALSWPLERHRGIVARLARENVTRVPARTSITASSLMIGLALVLFVSVYIGGVRTATRRAIARTFAADFAIGSADGSSSIPPSTARALGVMPDLSTVSAIKTADARLAGVGRVIAAGIDPTTIGHVYHFAWRGPSPDPTTLGPDDALLERETALADNLRVGDRVTVTSPDGLRSTLTVRGIYADRGLLRGITMPVQTFDSLFHQDRFQQVLVKLTPGADRGAVEAQLGQALAGLPGVVVRSERQLADEASGKVNSVFVLFYALLAMSAVMALLGMLNTLALSIHERTRELGVLRAMGMTRRQATAMIRGESLITAVVGTLVGAVLGIGLAWVISRALSSQGIVFAVPWPQLALVAGAGLAVGVLAAVPPALRAARIDVLSALAHE